MLTFLNSFETDAWLSCSALVWPIIQGPLACHGLGLPPLKRYFLPSQPAFDFPLLCTVYYFLKCLYSKSTPGWQPLPYENNKSVWAENMLEAAGSTSAIWTVPDWVYVMWDSCCGWLVRDSLFLLIAWGYVQSNWPQIDQTWPAVTVIWLPSDLFLLMPWRRSTLWITGFIACKVNELKHSEFLDGCRMEKEDNCIREKKDLNSLMAAWETALNWTMRYDTCRSGSPQLSLFSPTHPFIAGKILRSPVE